MSAIILIAHGSRHPQAAGTIEQLAHAVAQLTGRTTVTAHLEFDTPNLNQAAADLQAAGHTDATVVPLLFTNGYHHRIDLPAAVDAATAYTAQRAAGGDGIRLTLAPGLGTGEDMARVLAAQVVNPKARLVLWAVGSSDPAANASVAALAQQVAGLTGQHTEAVFATRAGPARLSELRQRTAPEPPVEILALFVAPGVLLDGIDAVPLGTALAPIVAARAGHPQPALVGHSNQAPTGHCNSAPMGQSTSAHSGQINPAPLGHNQAAPVAVKASV